MTKGTFWVKVSEEQRLEEETWSVKSWNAMAIMVHSSEGDAKKALSQLVEMTDGAKQETFKSCLHTNDEFSFSESTSIPFVYKEKQYRVLCYKLRNGVGYVLTQ